MLKYIYGNAGAGVVDILDIFTHRLLAVISFLMFALMREYISTCFYTFYGEKATNIKMLRY